MPPGGHTLVDARSLGDLSAQELAVALRPLWEDAGPLVARLEGRPVGSWDEHLTVAASEIAGMDPGTRAQLLRAHPRIGADPVSLAARSPESWAEQGGATPDVPAVRAALDELNDRYERRYGFPFVEWVAGRSKSDIVAVIGWRLTRDRRTELDAGCDALVAIARDRLARIRSGAS